MPSRSTRGSQVHQADLSTESMTEGTWLPQPHQVDLPGDGMLGLGLEWGWGREDGTRGTEWVVGLPQVLQVAGLHIVAVVDF